MTATHLEIVITISPCLKLLAMELLWEMPDDELKEIAEYVTDSVNDDGIYHAFKHYHLI